MEKRKGFGEGKKISKERLARIEGFLQGREYTTIKQISIKTGINITSVKRILIIFEKEGKAEVVKDKSYLVVSKIA